MRRRTRHPLSGPYGLLLKFLFASLFGCMVSFLVFAVSVADDRLARAFWEGWWPNLLWIIPVVWGILGVFCFDRALELARDVLEGFLGIGR